MDAIGQIWALSPQLRLPMVAWFTIVTGTGLWFMWRGWRGDGLGHVRRCPICGTQMTEGLRCPACRFESRRERSLHFVRRDWPLIAGGFVIANFGMPIPVIELYALVVDVDLNGAGALLLAAPLIIACGFLWVGRRSVGCACPVCRYDMSGADGLTCPECGHEAASRKALYARRRRWWALVVGLLLLVFGFAFTRAWEGIAPALSVALALTVVKPLTRGRFWSFSRRLCATILLVGLTTWWSVSSETVYEEESVLPVVPTSVLILGMWHLPDSWITTGESSLRDRLGKPMRGWQRRLVRHRAHAALRRVGSLVTATRAQYILLEFKNDEFWGGATPAGRGLVSFVAQGLAEAPNQRVVNLASFAPCVYHPESVEPFVGQLIENITTKEDPRLVYWSAVFASTHPDVLEASAPALIASLAVEQHERLLQARYNVVRTILEDCSDETRALFLASLKTLPEHGRYVVIRAFVVDSSGSSDVTEALMQLVASDDLLAGDAAVSLALRGHRVEELIPLMFEKLEGDGPGRVKFALALSATGEALRPYAVRFADAVHDDDVEVVLAVIQSMRYLHDDGFPLEPWQDALHAAAANEQLRGEWGMSWVREALEELAD